MNPREIGRLAAVAVPEKGTASADVTPSKATWLRLGSYQPAEKDAFPSNLPSSDGEPEGIFMRTNGALLVNVSAGGTWSAAGGWSTKVTATDAGSTADATIDVATGTALIAATGLMIYACRSAGSASAPASVFEKSSVADELSGPAGSTVAIGASGKLSIDAPNTRVTSHNANYHSTSDFVQTCDALTAIAHGSFASTAHGTSLAASGAFMVTAQPFSVSTTASSISTAYALITQAVANTAQTGYAGGIYLARSEDGGAAVRLQGLWWGQSITSSDNAVVDRSKGMVRRSRNGLVGDFVDVHLSRPASVVEM